MKKKFQPANTRFAPTSKWPQALLLSVGLTGFLLQAQAREQTVVSTDQSGVLTLTNTSDHDVFINPGVTFTVSDVGASSQSAVIKAGNNSVLKMEKDSKITLSNGNGVWMYDAKAEFNGATIAADGAQSNALFIDGLSNVELTDTHLSAKGTDGHAVVMSNIIYQWDSSVVVNGGSLISEQAEAVLLEGDSLRMTIDKAYVSGTHAIKLTDGGAITNNLGNPATSTNTIHITDSRLTGTNGNGLILEGSNTFAKLYNTKVVSQQGRSGAIHVNGPGNRLDMEKSELEIDGAGQFPVGALSVMKGVADVRDSSIVAKGNQASGVQISNASANLENVFVSTSGNESSAIFSNGSAGRLTVSGGTIETKGDKSDGIHVSYNSTATVSGTHLDIAGNHSNGVTVLSDSVIDIRDSTVNLTNRISDGAAYVANGTGVQLNVTDSNANGSGTVAGLNAAGGAVRISGGSIRTENGAAAVISDGAGVMINNGATLRTTGAAAHAIQLGGGARSTVTVDGATVSAQGAGADIFRSDGGVADVVVSNGATINTDGNLLNLQSLGGVGSDVRFVVDNAAVKGNITIDNNSTGNVMLRNGGVLTGSIDPTALTIESGGQWNAIGNSTMTSTTLNGGTVNFGQPQGSVFRTIQTTTLDGSGGRILMHARLGDGSDPADLLHITGDASGTHVLDVKNAGGAGAQTNGDGIRLVQADGRSDADNFKLAGGAVQIGMYEYFLTQGGQSRARDWYLKSTRRASLPAYVMTPTLNRDYGYSAIGTLHERTGDLANIARGDKGSEGSMGSDGVWGRIGGAQLRTGSSEQIDASARSSFMQFGKDWKLGTDANGTSTHSGVTATLGEMHASFSDGKRLSSGSPVGRDTGTAKTRAMGLGGYWTRYFADGTYVDTVGQLTRYGTDYKDAYALGASSKGSGLALSVEAGKPFASYGSLRLEAQGQMIYQYLRTDAFNDGASEIAVNGSHGLRGRAGVRIFRELQEGDTPRSAAPYAIFNVWHNFSGAASVGIDGQSMQTQTNKTWGEVGVGITGRLSERGMLHAGLKYRHQLGGLQFEGAAGEVGYRYSW